MKFFSTLTILVAIVATFGSDVFVNAKPTKEDWHHYKHTESFYETITVETAKLGFSNEQEFFKNVIIPFKNLGEKESTWYFINPVPNVTTSRFWGLNEGHKKEGLVVSEIPTDARKGAPFVFTLGGWAKGFWIPKKYGKHLVEYIALEIRTETFKVHDVSYKWNKHDQSAIYGIYLKNGATYANCWTVDTKAILAEKKVNFAVDVKYIGDGILKDDDLHARLIKW